MNKVLTVKALENLASVVADQVRENIKLKQALGSRDEELADVRERAEYMERERTNWKNAAVAKDRHLCAIAHYLSESWLSDPNEDWDNLAKHLNRAGFSCVRDWGGEPEPFIHGDSAEGAEG